jgi:hypothetical protein
MDKDQVAFEPTSPVKFEKLPVRFSPEGLRKYPKEII